MDILYLGVRCKIVYGVRAHNMLCAKRSYLIYPCPSSNGCRPDVGPYRDNLPNKKEKDHALVVTT